MIAGARMGLIAQSSSPSDWLELLPYIAGLALLLLFIYYVTHSSDYEAGSADRQSGDQDMKSE